ncbi:MAG: hypothetical protein M1825_001289 [Sarcosagium campestre]|nr:MAG: hypothetical protein M1825_001289 [Sarcosagium campestre]
MAGESLSSSGASPTGTSKPFQPGTPSSSASSPPQNVASGSQFARGSSSFAAQPSQSQQQTNFPFSYGMPSIGEGNTFIKDKGFHNDVERASSYTSLNGASTILIRRLARNMTENELRSMFLFAKDFVESEFTNQDFAEDKGLVSAIARFKSVPAALEAKAMLDGKPNTASETTLIVEILNASAIGSYGTRRNTYDGPASRVPSSSASSSASSNGANTRQSSRYNGTFQSMEKVSPPAPGFPSATSTASGELPMPEAGSHLQNIFSPKSPIGNQANERPRVSGKSIITDDSVDDDETGELLKDPVAYARNGHSSSSNGQMSRRITNPHLPISRFAGLSLATNNISPPNGQNFASPRSAAPQQGQAHSAAISPIGVPNHGSGSNFQLASQHFARPNYPPVNPADQNPPCNTLYVGNLPIDTSEDELKAMFSKQRGYKRLCFRTKQNGPMCFVEFEDVSFATKALNDLYGHPLHNSVKGGIRLSFSKNPLGVRTGQPGNAAGMASPSSPHSSLNAMNGVMGGMQGQPFMTASGPPPGLAAPPGLNGTAGMSSPISSGGGGVMNGGLVSANYGMVGMRGPSMGGAPMGGAPMNGVTNGFPEYMMGK